MKALGLVLFLGAACVAQMALREPWVALAFGALAAAVAAGERWLTRVKAEKVEADLRAALVKLEEISRLQREMSNRLGMQSDGGQHLRFG